MTEFIYCPKTGDRVFVERHITAEIAVLKWANGSRHVIGGVKLSYHAANPGKWWRNAAQTMAETIVKQFGGIAWDEQGIISLIVPLHAGRAAKLMMDSACRLSGGEMPSWDMPDENDVRLILAGWSSSAQYYGPDDNPTASRLIVGHSHVVPSHIVEARFLPGEEESLDGLGRAGLVGRVLLTVWDAEGKASQLEIKAPSSWGKPEVNYPAMWREVVETVA